MLVVVHVLTYIIVVRHEFVELAVRDLRPLRAGHEGVPVHEATVGVDHGSDFGRRDCHGLLELTVLLRKAELVKALHVACVAEGPDHELRVGRVGGVGWEEEFYTDRERGDRRGRVW